MSSERWLVTGPAGQLGGHVIRLLRRESDSSAVISLIRPGSQASPDAETMAADLRDHTWLRKIALAARPTHVVHLAALTSVAEAHARPDEAIAINATATQILAEAAAQCGARFVFSSTDMVFDGCNAPYRETDPPAPLSCYGRSKVAAEQHVLAAGGLVVRLPLMYGLPVAGRQTTFSQQITTLRAGGELKLFTDEYRTPVWLPDAARALIGLARSGETGLLHVAGSERLSRFDLIARIAQLLDATAARLIPVSRLSLPATEPRPEDLSLDDGHFRRRHPQLAASALTDRGPSDFVLQFG